MGSYKLKQRASIHEAASYLAKGVKLHPLLNEWYTEELAKLERLEYVCLMPSVILQRYHKKLRMQG